MRDGTTQFDANGTVAITGGMAPAPALIGDAAHLTVSAAAAGSNVTISRFAIDGRKITVSAAGSLDADKLAFDWQLGLPDLTSVLPTLAGALQLQGQVSGPIDDFAAGADLSGTLGPVGKRQGPISANAQLRGLPSKPVGSITAQGVLEGAPLELALAAARADDGELRVTLEAGRLEECSCRGDIHLGSRCAVPARTARPTYGAS